MKIMKNGVLGIGFKDKVPKDLFPETLTNYSIFIQEMIVKQLQISSSVRAVDQTCSLSS